MQHHILTLPDGTELSSGTAGGNAILSVSLTQCVNEGQELTLGSTCAGCLEVSLFMPNGDLSITAGQELTLWKQDEAGNREKIGMFTAENPQYADRYTLKLTAYDRVSRLDKDLTGWLAALTQWPYKLYDFADLVCDACGLTLANEDLPNGDYPVQAFAAQGITGRQLIRWVGQIVGRFCRATSDGAIEFAWYTDAGVEITPGGDRYYYQNGLRFEDYGVAPIEKVQLQLTQEDVGAVWPREEGEKNTYILTGNYLLTTQSTDELLPIAKSLYEQLKEVSYTPCRVTVPEGSKIAPGQSLQITDPSGKTVTAYVMTKTCTGGRDTLECTGSRRRSSTSAVNSQDYKMLNGKMLELRKNADGILSRVTKVETQAADAAGALTDTNTRLTQLEQAADGLRLHVQSIQEKGTHMVTTTTGFTFDGQGMTVEKSGREVKTQITEDGMTVSRNGQQMLVANAAGVLAKDLNASTYLIVGGLSRFENYNGRTGCFWIGGS